MFHKLTSRRVFVDELYVSPTSRRRGLAKALMHAVAKGPIELIVSQTNTAAIAFYLSIGFCVYETPYFAPRQHEFCLRTSSFAKTKQKTSTTPQLMRAVEIFRWDQLTPETQQAMVRALSREWTISQRDARRNLRTTDPSVRYAVL